ncbi:MAG: hypothetical protein Q9187_007235 [Circinaria calcarea]
MAGAKTLEELASAEYWDARYSSTAESTYEWFKSYNNLKPFFSRHLPAAKDENRANVRLLHLGCGNSTLPMDLVLLGYDEQVCVDFSAVVIANMASRYSAEKAIDWRVMDVRHMVEFRDEEFEVAIDKGTLDAMISGSPWDPPLEVKQNTSEYINEVSSNFLNASALTGMLASAFALRHLMSYGKRMILTRLLLLTALLGFQNTKTRRRLSLHHLSTATLHEADIDEGIMELGNRGPT